MKTYRGCNHFKTLIQSPRDYTDEEVDFLIGHFKWCESREHTAYAFDAKMGISRGSTEKRWAETVMSFLRINSVPKKGRVSFRAGDTVRLTVSSEIPGSITTGKETKSVQRTDGQPKKR